MLLRTLIFALALAPSEVAHGASLDAAASLTPACPVPTSADAPPPIVTAPPAPQDDFKLIYSCANATPSI